MEFPSSRTDARRYAFPGACCEVPDTELPGRPEWRELTIAATFGRRREEGSADLIHA